MQNMLTMVIFRASIDQKKNGAILKTLPAKKEFKNVPEYEPGLH